MTIKFKKTGEGAVLPDMRSETIELSTGRVITAYLTGEKEVTVITGEYETFEDHRLTDEITEAVKLEFGFV